jgi:ABC-type uncharacterized transport system substrate-binding protein
MTLQTFLSTNSPEAGRLITAAFSFLTFDPDASRSTRFGPFFESLRDRDYVDGQTISIDYLANGDGERFPALATECLRLKADIIAVSTTPATQAAKKVTHTIPIVMIALCDCSLK